MYIRVNNNSSQIINMDDYLLKKNLRLFMDDIELKDLSDGNNYYTKDEIQDILNGDLDLKNYVTDDKLESLLSNYMTSVTLLYVQTDDNQNPPDKNSIEWSDSIPVVDNEKYLWQLIQIGKPGIFERTNPVCISGPQKGNEDEEEEIAIVNLIDIKPSWCLNNNGDWSLEIYPTEYDEVWMRNELFWDDGNITYTEPVKDQLYEITKDILLRLITVEENITDLKENSVSIEKLQELTNHDDSNLLKNGNFYNRTTDWTLFGTGNNIPRLQNKSEFPHGAAIVFQGELQHAQSLNQFAYPLTNVEGIEYTFSCMVQCDDAYDGYEQPFYGLKVKVNYKGREESINETFTAEIEHIDNTWNRLHVTFTVNRQVEDFLCSFYVSDTTKTIRVSEFQLTQGTLIRPFKPSFKEIFEKLYSDSIDINLSNYALLEDIPIKLSELENDMDFLMEIPDEYITEDELQQALDGLQLETPEVTPTITKVSELENDSAFISYFDIYVKDENGDFILDENGNYIIEKYASYNSVEELQNQIKEINNKNYLTEHQDISHLALKSEVEELRNEIKQLHKIIEELKNNVPEQPEVIIATVDEAIVDNCYTADSEDK